MPKDNSFDELKFNNLLKWLDNDLEIAANKYESIRSRLIKIFTTKGHFDAENLADKTIDRVCHKVAEIAADYTGRQELYFYGVARNIHREALKRPIFVEVAENLTTSQPEEEISPYYECLKVCIKTLSADEQHLVVNYYQNEKGAKVEDRKKIADSLNITLNFLRLKVYRLRNELRNCILNCVKKES